MSRLSISAAARDAGDRVAIVTATRELTFAECAQLVAEQCAARDPGAQLAAARREARDPNAQLAAVQREARDPSAPREARDSGAQRAAAPREAREPCARAIVATSTVETILAVYAALDAERPLGLVHAKLRDAERDAQLAAVDAAALPAGTAFVLFTSGSTGPARGVVLSRGAILAAADASAARLTWRDDDRWLSCLPMAHAGGLSIAVRCLAARKPVVLHDADFDPARVAELARDRRATIASLVPTQLAALLATRAEPHALRAVVLGGAAAAPALIADAVARGWPVLPSYGLTETFGQVATALAPGGPPVALPGAAISAHETLHVRGAMLATAYLDGTPIAPELVTADLGGVRSDGTVHILGRLDDVIVTGGEKVHPQAVEAVLAATPGVRAACAFAVPDARWGHVVAAALAVGDLAAFDRAGALARWHAALPAYARPRRLALAAALPLLPSGKLDRRAIASLPVAAIEYES